MMTATSRWSGIGKNTSICPSLSFLKWVGLFSLSYLIERHSTLQRRCNLFFSSLEATSGVRHAERVWEKCGASSVWLSLEPCSSRALIL